MQQTELVTNDATIVGLTNVNIILGRNGAGKSRFLRSLEMGLANSTDFNVRYLSPERGGVFKRGGNVDTHMEANKDWLRNNRNKNQVGDFKAVSAYLIRDVEVTYLRRLASTPSIRQDADRNFHTDRLEKINRLLINISLELERAEFVLRNASGEPIAPEDISSGESEAIALASEIMYFFETLDKSKFNVLLLDEPDVHLHPDLQARLAKLIKSEIEALSPEDRSRSAICLATHSTPLVCAFADSKYTSIGTKDFGTVVSGR